MWTLGGAARGPQGLRGGEGGEEEDEEEASGLLGILLANPGGICCPCPRHASHHSTPAALTSLDPRLALFREDANGALVAIPLGYSVQRGEKVYARAGYNVAPSAAPWDAHAVFTWTEGNATFAQTNAFTLLGMYFLPYITGGLGSDSTLMGVRPPPEGWVVMPRTLRKMRLDAFIGMPGERVLSLDSTGGGFRVWASADTNAPPLLTPGTAVTNNLPLDIWFMAAAPGAATLTHAYTGTSAASNLTHTAYYTLTARPPAIGFKRADGTLATQLAVGRWENAFTNDNGTVRLAASDFINLDPDRFRVYLDDPRRTEATVDILVRQDGLVTVGSRTVTLYRQPDGTYLSTNLLIVADEEDKNLSGLSNPSAAPDSPDRMFTAGLFDYVSAFYEHDGAQLLEMATVGVDIRFLSVKFAAMKTNGVPCVSTGIVERDMRRLRERYAQANIYVDTVRLPDFPAPPSIAALAFTNWAVRINIEDKVLTTEAKVILDAAGPAHKEVFIVYVPSIWPYPDAMAQVAGMCVAPFYFETKDDIDYQRNAFVSAKVEFLFAPAHEVGHSLWLEHKDAPSPWHLMNPRAGFPGNTPQSAKRFTTENITTMREKLP